MFSHLKLANVNLFNLGLRRFSNSCISSERFKVAIVGSGPAGFYVAHHMLRKAPDSVSIHLDFIERLKTPFGLSRYGVAPDHPEVKKCEDYLNDLMDNNLVAHRHRVRFLGNVEVGKDVLIKKLASIYNSIVFATGSTASDNSLNVPGENLKGIVSARDFVNWYNGHPDFVTSLNKFNPNDLKEVENVTIVGNGNVALDVARVLLADPESHWAPTDIVSEAVDLLKQSNVKRVKIVARRGFLESAFTNKEIRELLKLSKQNVKFEGLNPSAVLNIDPKKLGRVNQRRLSIVKDNEKYSKDLRNPTKVWSLQYLMSPKDFVSDDGQKVSATNFVRNQLVEEDGIVRVRLTSEVIQVKNELVILSIGYKGATIDGFDDFHIEFDGTSIKNIGGRIIDSVTGEEQIGFYTSGWAKTGPKGVIATTMMDSFLTAETILTDLVQGKYLSPSSEEDIANQNGVTCWEDWKVSNELEITEGAKKGKSREKILQ